VPSRSIAKSTLIRRDAPSGLPLSPAEPAVRGDRAGHAGRHDVWGPAGVRRVRRGDRRLRCGRRGGQRLGGRRRVFRLRRFD